MGLGVQRGRTQSQVSGCLKSSYGARARVKGEKWKLGGSFTRGEPSPAVQGDRKNFRKTFSAGQKFRETVQGFRPDLTSETKVTWGVQLSLGPVPALGTGGAVWIGIGPGSYHFRSPVGVFFT